MNDLKRRLGDIEGYAPPDLWQEITSRGPRPAGPELGPGRRIVVAVVTLAVAAAALAFVVRAFRSNPSTPANPTPSVSNGPIWALGGGGEAGALIYAVDPATGAKTPLWSDGRNPDFPNFTVDQQRTSDNYVFSPDGSRVAFSHYVKEGPPDCCDEIFEMNADGTGLSQVTHDHAYASFPSWSPDGAQIVYTSYRGEHYVPGCDGSTLCPGDLYAIGADGSGERQLTNDPADESMPSWSPDGSRVVFRSTLADSGGGLYVMNPDGSDMAELAANPGGFVLYPAWSPDGSKILFLFATPNERFGVWVVNPDGADMHQLIDTNADTNFAPPLWSPDGAEIAFAKLVEDEPQLWVMGADGSEPHMVAALPRYGISPLAWKPGPQLVQLGADLLAGGDELGVSKVTGRVHLTETCEPLLQRFHLPQELLRWVHLGDRSGFAVCLAEVVLGTGFVEHVPLERPRRDGRFPAEPLPPAPGPRGMCHRPTRRPRRPGSRCPGP